MRESSEIVGLRDNEEGKEDKDRMNKESNPRIKNAFIVYMWSIGITMGSFVFGYSLVVTTVLGSSIGYEFKQSGGDEKDVSFYLSICASVLPLGALIGSILYSRIMKMIGSENTAMMICDFLIIFLYTLQTVSLDVKLIAFIRFSLGFIIGVAGTLVPMYIMSIAPTKISGKVGSLNQILITIGIAVAYGMGFLIDENQLGNWWRWRVCVFFPVYFCFLRIYTCLKFKYDTLERHIEREDFHSLKEYIDLVYEPSTFSVQELIESKKTHSNKKQSNQNQIQIHSSSLKKRIVLSLSMTIMNQFSGINAIIFYANQLFLDISKGDAHYAVLMSFYMGIFQIAITIISGSLLDKYGRRSLMVFGETVIILALLSAYYMLDYSSGWDPKYATYAIFAHIAGFSLSLGPITFIYLSEILDDISPFMVLVWIETVLISAASNLLIEKYGIGKIFLFFGVVSIACFTHVFTKMLETKGKTKRQIIQQFQGQGAVSHQI